MTLARSTADADAWPRGSIPMPLAVFVLAYMVVFSAAAWRQGNDEFMIYAGAMAVIIAVVVVLHRRVRFCRRTLWLLAAWGVLHMAGGTVPIPETLADASGKDAAKAVLYSLRPADWLPRYDQITHAFGFFSATLACWDAIAGSLRRRRAEDRLPSVGLALAAALMGCGLGAANEVLEFAATRLLPETNVGGYVNTGWDLVANTVGTLAAAGLLLLERARTTR
jgi:uncharacterized membrane protein YjdF